MIKEKELSKIKQVRFRDGDAVTFESLEEQLALAADNYAIPVAFGRDQIKSGGLIGSSLVDCMMLFHPQYQAEYNFYVFSITRQGKYAFVDLYMGGNSVQGTLMEAKEQVMSGNFSALTSTAKGAVIGSLVGNALTGKLFQGKNKFEEEKNWYTMINDIFDDVFEK